MSSPEPSALSAQVVARAAAEEVAAFRARIDGVPYERKGILFSEMFFLYLCARHARPKRILESGRARGQSTFMLALCFPDLPIVSLEHDERSPDVPVAAERLRRFGNVELRFGDAMHDLPAMAREGDVALIDGPKGFRAIRLALRLLGEGRTSLVFIHDMTHGTAERRFLDRHMPSAIYSDNPAFAAIAHNLDSAAEDIPAPLRWGAARPQCAYGYGLACISRQAGSAHRWARAAAVFTGFATRVGR